jgi:beta-glucosidase
MPTLSRKAARAPSLLALTAAMALAPLAQAAQPERPWMNPKLGPDERARLVEREMTQNEKLALVRSRFGAAFKGAPSPLDVKPDGALGSAGYVAGIPRLGLPALQLSDAGLGVANGGHMRPGDEATALPSGLATAASWNPALAREAGAMIGAEAHAKGFNVLLAGAANLTRDPRNGRNFEYAGEDPLLSGVMVGEAIAGVQSAHIISTTKHFAINAQETGRNVVSSDIDEKALRESDLLAFEIAIERGQPGSVMTGYNRVNGLYASESPYLLTKVLKGDWRFPGWVMSDWGGLHSTVAAANAGLDQQSGQAFDQLRAIVLQAVGGKTTPAEADFFGAPLGEALASGAVSQVRLDDMVHRILRTMFDKGVVDHPATLRAVDRAAHADIARRAAEQGIVLLKNDSELLPLAASAKRIAVIGGHADVGVLSGGGSSQVIPYGGATLELPVTTGVAAAFSKITYGGEAPLKALADAAPAAKVEFASGQNLAQATALAARSDIVVVFAGRWQSEGDDSVDLSLGDGQDALISAVAKVNPRVVVVLQTGNPVAMPWLGEVGAVIEAWFPGSQGGAAIANVLTGKVNPSGKLPMTFPVDESQLPRQKIDGLGMPAVPLFGVFQPFSVRYQEGADLGYRWFARTNAKPLFPFGHGLSYTRFTYAKLATRAGSPLTVSVEVANIGERDGVEIVQLYVTPPGATARLAGWARVPLKAGERETIRIVAEPRTYSEHTDKGWILAQGDYAITVGGSSVDTALSMRTKLTAN